MRIRAAGRVAFVFALTSFGPASARAAVEEAAVEEASAVEEVSAPDEAAPEVPVVGPSVGELFQDGQKKFEAGAFNEAVDLWTRAYTQLPPDDVGNRSRLQLSLANAHFEAYGVDGEVAHARRAERLYREYLETADIDEELRLEIDGKRARIQEILEEERRREAARLAAERDEAARIAALREKAEAEAERERIAAEEAAQGPLSSRVRKALLISGSLTTVVGAGLLGVMGYGLYRGSAADDEGAAAREQEPLDRDELQRIRVEGENANTLAVATGVAGGIVTVAGLAMIVTSQLTSRPARRRQVSLLPGVSPRDLGLALRLRF